MKNLSASHLTDSVIAVGAHLEAELDEALAEAGVTRGSFLVLRELAAADGGRLTQRALGDRLRRTAGTLSVRLGRLARAGMITREPHAEDRRASVIAITDRGRELLDTAAPLYAERARRLTAALGDPALAAVSDGVATWLEFFEPSEREATRLGVAIVPAATAARMRRAVGLPERPGVLVVKALRDRPGAQAGLDRGDLITAAGGEAIRTVADLERALRRAGDRLALEVVRGVEPRTVEVAL